jgi:hypothetical protein
MTEMMMARTTATSAAAMSFSCLVYMTLVSVVISQVTGADGLTGLSYTWLA